MKFLIATLLAAPAFASATNILKYTCNGTVRGTGEKWTVGFCMPQVMPENLVACTKDGVVEVTVTRGLVAAANVMMPEKNTVEANEDSTIVRATSTVDGEEQFVKVNVVSEVGSKLKVDLGQGWRSNFRNAECSAEVIKIDAE